MCPNRSLHSRVIRVCIRVSTSTPDTWMWGLRLSTKLIARTKPIFVMMKMIMSEILCLHSRTLPERKWTWHTDETHQRWNLNCTYLSLIVEWGRFGSRFIRLLFIGSRVASCTPRKTSEILAFSTYILNMSSRGAFPIVDENARGLSCLFVIVEMVFQKTRLANLFCYTAWSTPRCSCALFWLELAKIPKWRSGLVWPNRPESVGK